MKKIEERITAVVAHAKQELIAIRGSRPSAKMFEDISVEQYGNKVPIKRLGTVTVSPPRDVIISVWDQNAAGAIAKAIEDAHVGGAPNVEKNIVRVALPQLTDERRRELLKYAGKVAEEHRIQIRAAREETNKHIDAAEDRGEIGEDEKFRFRERVQKSVEHANAEIGRLMEQKEKDIND
ncbi:MAG: ribosome recycling factor [Candidatus Liptonbacteria bacterium]|nr:ribosome recycling factor [Candidatus Liptonbacteria bacterium]